MTFRRIYRRVLARDISALGSGLLAPFYPSTMYAPYTVPIVSPPRSTPSLEPDSLDHEYPSPPDEYLSTPDLSEWREIRRLEYEKDRSSADEPHTASPCPQLDLPLLDLCKQRPPVLEISSALPPWPYTTIAPEDAFPDYAQVRQYLQEQARPSPPPSELPESDDDAPPLCTNVVSPPENPPSPRRIGQKAKRGDDDDDADDPAPVPLDSDDDRDLADDDGSGSFQPSRRPLKRQRVCTGPSKRRQNKVARRPARPKSTKPKCNRGEDYQEGPCSCQSEACPHCLLTCFYTFVHGPRKGDVCRRLFESNRQMDLRRHKITHAVQEWKWLEDGEITPQEARWHLVDFEGKEHGLICPNGDCSTTFTRYDALKRHMERGTCQFMHRGSSSDLDNRQLKAKIMKASNEKYERLNDAKKHA